MSSLKETLARVDLFAGLPHQVISDLVDAGTTFTTPPGGTIVTQGSSSAGLQIVLEGSANVDVNNDRRPALSPGSYFGEISVIDGGGRSATVTAGDQGLKTFAISPANFSGLIGKHPDLARSLLKTLCARIRALEAADASRQEDALN
jgi:CRP/FNR family transcriptional regulator, cyclic AMP receptor protein